MDGRADHNRSAVKARRALRFTAQSHAQRVLTARARATHPGKHPGSVYRTAACLWTRVADVEIHRSIEHAKAHYTGLVTCGSVWACPNCAAKIQERRRAEIEHAMTWAASNGLTAIMPTFTFPHRSFQTLAELLEKQAAAFRYFRQTRGYRRLMKALSFGGLVRGLEVTHGQNGWHPHTHELWFIAIEMDAGALRDELAELWLTACIAAGLVDASDDPKHFLARSVHVQANATAGDYLAKQDDSRSWGLAHEVAKATSKAGRAKGVHPHHFLIRKAKGDDALYIEYVDGMKGRRQLFWSPGLKAKVGVAEKSDEEIAEEQIEQALHLYTLTHTAWNYVRGNDARAELLEAAEHSGAHGIEALLRSLGYHEPENTHAPHGHSQQQNPQRTLRRDRNGRSEKPIRKTAFRSDLQDAVLSH